MAQLRYQHIEEQLADALPELQPAAQVYAKVEGPPGKDPGAYIFFESMFATYVEVLLAMRESAGRNRLLARAFCFVDEMLTSDDCDVRNLANVGLYEGRDSWWYGRALPFFGPGSRELNRLEPQRLAAASLDCGSDLEREIIDLYGVRDVVLQELQHDGYGVTDMPGITAPRSWERFSQLNDARHDDNAVAFLSCFGTSRPYVVCPIADVHCDEPTLRQLSRDLAEIDQCEPNQTEKSQAAFFRISLEERVWNMTAGAARHARFSGQTWIAQQFVQRGLRSDIQAVLNSIRPRLTSR